MALTLGGRGQGRTAPNPSVGCVIVQHGRVVGRGHTAAGGRPHAETIALAQAGAQAQGATVYVTLEPCSHKGQTPPCAQALINAGVARVVTATQDPNPLVQGRGIAMMQAAGIEVISGVLADQAEVAHAGFFAVQRLGRPAISLKLAASLDGRIATQTGQSQWITGAQARRMVHLQRARHDAVMIGAGTLRADDPSLDVRDLGMSHQPARVVVSRHLDLPLTCKLAQSAGKTPVIIVHGQEADPNLQSAWRGLGAHLLAVPSSGLSGLDLSAAMTELAQFGLTRIYCEGGGSLAASLLQADLVDDIQLFQAGKIIGAEGLAMVGSLGLHNLAEAPAFELAGHRRIGEDTVSHWRRARFSI